MNNKISNTELKPGTLVAVTGKVGYSHIATLIMGEELEADMKRREEKGIAPITRAYTTITLYEAELYNKKDELSTEETYIVEHFYESQNEKLTGNCISINNKTESLPEICQLNGNKICEVQTSGSELKKGLRVLAFIRVYEGTNGIGVSLERVAAIDPIKFRTSNRAGYESLGFEFEDSSSGDSIEDMLPPVQ